jgi:hypothetical protein
MCTIDVPEYKCFVIGLLFHKLKHVPETVFQKRICISNILKISKNFKKPHSTGNQGVVFHITNVTTNYIMVKVAISAYISGREATLFGVSFVFQKLTIWQALKAKLPIFFYGNYKGQGGV